MIKNYKDFSYMIGLFQTDGHLNDSTRDRGRLSLELSKKDIDIINKISFILPVNFSIKERERDTNFKENYSSVSLNIFDLDFRNLIKKWGVPAGAKSKIVKPPLHIKELSINDYIRGLYDGDGSVGFTAKGFPYVSFVTQSEDIKDFLVDFISKITSKSKKEPNRNKRDEIYNITITKEDAIVFCKEIYKDNHLCLDRKFNNAQEVIKWIRPEGMIISNNKKKWTKEEDEFILSHSISESMDKLNRSNKSINLRRWRLKNPN
jgi:hypothetical protein